MAEPESVGAAAIAHSAAAIAARLSGRIDDVTAAIYQHLVDEISELRGDPQLLDLLRDSTEGNVDTLFSALRHDIPITNVEPPTAALEYARRLAQRGVSVNALVRAYRLGQQTLLGVVLDEVRDTGLDPQRSLDMLRQITVTTFNYIDWISQQVIATYQSERDRWLETQNSTRALRVGELLETDTDVADVDATSAAIGYPLRRSHLAVVIWCRETGQGDELGRMERFIRDLGENLGSHGAPLFVAADTVTAWGWIPLTAAATDDAVTCARRFAERHPQLPSLAIGDPLSGVDGFRHSHRQAVAAHTVALAAGGQDQRVVANADPGLAVAALLSENLTAARGWVCDVLGPLASTTESDQRLRETLRVFLQAGSSYKAAAAELNMHFNTVKYRVQRAEQRRGRPIDDRIEVELALVLCHWLHSAVLR
ncbi:helix-turn-helix domain-containing protein [[Mycobacterium] kokjensenii]|uniref:Helix-turn-helix domain-containing protein n=1 Tax=[Mycobacterium] kokjensenii TaxID=3064287 RepID=A0ABM9LTQ2_9MYCO|nr:helix-turn-helix domain-containing protein [Mycolicibacter sp. MU0083]CAJ1504515.1 helix-turn-helix domain-containing protein [Mycolicibacter sp. MU0083]